MDLFANCNYHQYTTADEFVSEKARLEALKGNQSLVVVDELENTDTVDNQARLHLWCLRKVCSQFAWQRSVKKTLRKTGLLN